MDDSKKKSKECRPIEGVLIDRTNPKTGECIGNNLLCVFLPEGKTRDDLFEDVVNMIARVHNLTEADMKLYGDNITIDDIGSDARLTEIFNNIFLGHVTEIFTDLGYEIMDVLVSNKERNYNKDEDEDGGGCEDEDEGGGGDGGGDEDDGSRDDK